MKRLLIVLIALHFIVTSCAVQKAGREEIALIIPKKGVEIPAAEKKTAVPGRPLEKTRGKTVIPPEKDVRRPGEKKATALPGIPGEKVEGVAESVLPGELAEEGAVPGEKIEIDEDMEFTEEIEKEMAMLFGKPIRETIVLFPFENLTNNRNVLKRVIPVLTKKLAEKGFRVIDEKSLKEFLCKRRVRHGGYLFNGACGRNKRGVQSKNCFNRFHNFVFRRGQS